MESEDLSLNISPKFSSKTSFCKCVFFDCFCDVSSVCPNAETSLQQVVFGLLHKVAMKCVVCHVDQDKVSKNVLWVVTPF